MELDRQDLDSNCWKCDDDATTWVHMTDGLRRYFCIEHVQDIFRHSISEEDLDEHPTCSHCRSCGRLTLREFCPANSCPECRSDTDADQYIEAIQNAANEFSEAQTKLTDEDGVVVEEG